MGRKQVKIITITVNGKEELAKECSTCGAVKELRAFYKNKSAAGGVDSRCKSCERKRKGSKKRTKKWNNQRVDNILPDGWKRLDEVINGQHNILVECENGHRSKRRPSDLETKEQRCLVCIKTGLSDRKKRWTNEYLDTELREKKPGWVRVSNVTGVQDTVTLLCEKNHINRKAPSDIFRTGCPRCSAKERWTNERLDLLLPHKWERLDDVGGAHKPIRLKCDQGHVFKISPGNLRNGSGCVVCNARNAIDYGKLFEKIVNELLTDLNIHYSKIYNQKCNPDYVLKNNVWMDAKLSRWTITQASCKTLEKYEPHCNLLIIVYLRGEVMDKMITKKTRLISVRLLIKQLPVHLQTAYINKIDEIETLLLLKNNQTA